MTPKTSSYRNQCRELLRLIDTIPLEAHKINPFSARRTLDELRSVAIVHVRLQNGVLHPWLQRQSSPKLLEYARKVEPMANAALNAMLTFIERWPSGARISSDSMQFLNEWVVASSDVRALIAHERAFYSLIDEHVLAPA